MQQTTDTRQRLHYRWQQFTAHCRHQFTEHPEATGESYLQHLWFTFTMSLRFLYVTLVLMIHGLFPFLLQRAASRQIEVVYGIMKTRIPKARRDELDMDYSV